MQSLAIVLSCSFEPILVECTLYILLHLVSDRNTSFVPYHIHARNHFLPILPHRSTQTNATHTLFIITLPTLSKTTPQQQHTGPALGSTGTTRPATRKRWTSSWWRWRAECTCADTRGTGEMLYRMWCGSGLM